jgi:fluoride exporter
MTAQEHTHDTAPAVPRPAFSHPLLVALVFLGGCLGTAGREGVALALPAHGGVPWAVLLVNLVGAFVLGLLLTALAATAPETPRRRDVRLFAGTGFCGGFTTYSSFATDTATLLETQPGVGVAYAIGSVVGGIALAALGVLLGAALTRRARGAV